jgi:hypothetical protein
MYFIDLCTSVCICAFLLAFSFCFYGQRVQIVNMGISVGVGRRAEQCVNGYHVNHRFSGEPRMSMFPE